MSKWKIKYVITDDQGKQSDKLIEVFGENVFDAYANADKVLAIIERGKKVEKIEVETHRGKND